MSTAFQRAVRECNVGLVKSLLDSGEDPNESPLDVYASIHHAIEHEDIAFVQLLLNESAIKMDKNLRQAYDGCTPLALAVKMKNFVIVKLLLEAESDPNICDYDGYAPIHHAIEHEDIALVRLLLNEFAIKLDVNSHKCVGWTPLALAVKRNNFAIIKLLLEAGSDPNICDSDGYAPIHHAIEHGDIALVRLLFDESTIKLDVNVHKCVRCTPLSLAVKTKNFAIVKLLLDAKADPNMCDIDGYAPIHHALKHGDIALVRLLLNESATKVDVNIQASDGCTPLVLAVKTKNIAIVKLLLEAKSNPNICGVVRYRNVLKDIAIEYGETPAREYGETPLIIAIRQNDTAIAKLLTEAGADINFPCENGDYWYTPFIMAVSQENLDMCELLIEHGYDVNMPILNKYHSVVHHSAVHLAAMINVDMVRYLVEKCNADIFVEPRRLLVNAIIDERPKTLDYILQHAYKLRDDEVWRDYKFSWPLHEALDHQYVTVISVLLRWGLNNAVFNIPVLDLGYMLTVFPSKGVPIINIPVCITVMKLLKQLYPHNLQDERFLNNRNTNGFSYSLEMQQFLIELHRESKNPSCLNIMCRTKIFQQLGYNPIPKAKKLPLPTSLINFVQFQDVEDLYTV